MAGTRPRRGQLHLLPPLLEGVVVVAAIVGVTYARLGFPIPKQGGEPLATKVLVVAAAWQLSLYFADLYERRTMLDRELTLIRIGQAMGTALFALSMIYYWYPDVAIGRGVMAISLLVLPPLAFVGRVLVDRDMRRRGTPQRLLVVGTSPESVALAHELHDRRHSLALEIVGFIDRDASRIGLPMFNPGIVGATGALGAAIASRDVDRVILSESSALDGLSLDELLRLRFSGVTFDHLAAVYEEYTGKLAVDGLTPMALMSSAGFQRHSWLLAVKRLSDIAMASIGLLLASPLMLVAAVWIKATSPGPVFYSQQRVGEDGQTFTIHKFRSMRADAEAETGAVWASDNDDRVTGVGRLLRRTRFDEVPQLWNVLRGEMSVVGPRPERPEMDVALIEKIPLYAERRLVKPGITGWAQVRYTYAASELDTRVKLQYDLFYVKNMSLTLDALIVLLTIGTIVRGSGAR